MKALAALSAGLAISMAGCDSETDSVNAPAVEIVDLIPHRGLEGFVAVLKEDSPTQDGAEAWKVEDGQLHVTGKGWGYLRSEKTYRDYHMTLEYRWGEFTSAQRENRARDCGVFVHASLPDRAFRGAWISSIEAQMVEGRAGDIIVIAALDSDSGKKAPHQLGSTVVNAEPAVQPGDLLFKPDAEPRTVPQPREQRVRLFRHPHDIDWKDEKGYRGPNEIEKPAGEWNTLEVIADGDTLEIRLNGRTVNRASAVTPTEGHVCLQSELSECWIRRWDLRPITP